MSNSYKRVTWDEIIGEQMREKTYGYDFFIVMSRNLRRIDLSGNMLDFISGSGSVNMLPPGLKQVDLSNNRIAFIQEGALSHMEKLALLDLKYVEHSSAVYTKSIRQLMRGFIALQPEKGRRPVSDFMACYIPGGWRYLTKRWGCTA